MNEKNNKKIKVIIISVVLVTLIGIAVAFFTSRSESGKKTVKVGNLSIIYENEKVFKLSNQFPVYDEDIEEDASKIEFTVRNNGDILEYASISMIDIAIDEKLKIPDFKYALYEKNISEPVKEGNFENAGTEINVGKNIEFAANASKDYVLYVWLSENDGDQSDLMGTTFKARIKLEGYGKKQVKKVLLSQMIKDNNSPISEDKPDFSTVATEDEGLIKDVDDDGDTYYFRGAVEDNYVKFNGLTWESTDGDYHSAGDDMLWRIVRINGDGTIRLIADGSIGDSAYNENFDDEKYVGYTYDNTTDRQDSTIKKFLEDWYNKNMMPYDEYIETSKFCNDTSTITDEEYIIEYGAIDRLYNNNPLTPSFKCPNTTKNYGGLYTNLKVGLITADEVIFAGGSPNDSNKSYYLYENGADFWTGSPRTFDPYFPNLDLSSGNGDVLVMDAGYMSRGIVDSTGPVLPVINLGPNLLYTDGDGSYMNPYVVG